MKKISAILPMLGVVFLFSCQTTGPVRAFQDATQQVVEVPKEFISPLAELEKLELKRDVALDKLPRKVQFKSDSWMNLMALSQTYESLEAEQESIESELEQSGELILQPGRSYSLKLESFCVEPGVSPPESGDGLTITSLKGPAKNWIPDILKKQGTLKISQYRVQTLIWALLSDVRFDELDEENQRALLQFYPNARIKFGNRKLENLGKGLFQNLLPGSIENTWEGVQTYKDEVLSYQEDFEYLARVLMPQSTRKTPLPVGWLKADDGYFLKLTAEGYSQVQVDILVPEILQKKTDLGRTVTSMKKLIFQPWKWIAVPKKGQKLALSTKSARKKKKAPKKPCEKLQEESKSYRCREMTHEDRKRILELADPRNFLKTRYQMPPRKGKLIEEETDCSHFTNEIYRRAGFDFPYASTGYMSCLTYLQEISGNQAQPGDLLLYKGHIGIMDTDGSLISATVGSDRSRGYRIDRSKLPLDDPSFKSSITKILSKQKLEHPGFGVPKIMRWSCP